jgi:flagellar motor switch protein FliN/FliY
MQKSVDVYFQEPKLVNGMFTEFVISAMSENQVMATGFREMAPIYDIPLHITIEVGRLRLRVRDLLKLSVGTVIELKKSAGEPFEICVNDHPIARGEAIAVDECACVRIVDVPKPAGQA